MIERHWKCITKPQNCDEYLQHLVDETFPHLSTIDGFKGSSILKRTTESGIEFLIITEWESMEAIKKFAGENPESAVVPPKVQNMMITFDRTVDHYTVVRNYDPQQNSR